MADFLIRNGGIAEEEFMKITYECILDYIAYNVCEKLKKDQKIEDFKDRARKRGKDGEQKTAKQLFSSYNLNDVELDYVSSVVISYIYKADRKSLDKIRKELTKSEELKCRSCGKSLNVDEIEIDHIRPYAYHGESNNPTFYQTLCHECNKEKTADPFFPIKFYCKRGIIPLYLKNLQKP